MTSSELTPGKVTPGKRHAERSKAPACAARPCSSAPPRSPSPFPSSCGAFGLDFYLSLASRIVVYAIAATSLNLVLGYAGLVSFGHAAFFGLGAYVTAIMISEGVQSGPLHLARRSRSPRSPRS